MIQVSKDAVRKFMRHGWNVYPLEPNLGEV